MKAKLIRLKPNSRFHFGRPMVDSNTSLNETDEYLHSDVLFSALINNLATIKTKDEINKFVSAFDNGDIKISSGFYCLENLRNDSNYEKITYFLPRPSLPLNHKDVVDYSRVKKIKRIKFVQSTILEIDNTDWILNNNFAVEKNFNQIFSPKNKFSLENIKLYRRGTSTHVGIRNKIIEGSEGGPFNVSYLSIEDLSLFNLKVHFYFLYEILDTDLKNDFDIAVDLIVYNGLGGERSNGYGAVEAIEEIENLPNLFTDRHDESYGMTLSKVIPRSEEFNQFTSYTYTVRGGRPTVNGVLKSVRMIDEGAIIKGKVKGTIVDLSPDNNRHYLRNGKAISIGFLNKPL